MNQVNNQPRRHREFILCGVFGLIIAGVFGATLYADFVQWDDDVNIYRNPSVQGLTAEHLYWMFTDVQYVRRYMPLGWLSWALDFQIYGTNPAGYHLGNLIFHYLSALLVFLILRKLFTAAASTKDERGIFVTAVAGALLWAIHPLRVEPVAWASGRLYCQATCGLLLCLFAYLKSTEGGASRRRWYGMSLASYAFSLLTYPLGLTLLPVLVILDYYPLSRWPRGTHSAGTATSRRVWVEKIPFAFLALGVSALAFGCRSDSIALSGALENFGVHSRIMQAFYVWACYVWKTWLPADLAPFYGTLANFNPNNIAFLGSAGLVMGISVVLIWQRRRWPAALACWLCYLVLLVPMLGLAEPSHDPSDRYSYLAGVAYAAGMAVLLQRWIFSTPRTAAVRFAPWRRRVRLTFPSVVLALLGFLSFAQCKIWESSDTMFVHIIETLEKHHRQGDLYGRLGMYRMTVGNFGGAAEAFRRALVLRPNSLLLHAELGNALAFQDKMKEAVTLYESVIAQVPDHRATRFKLARALVETGRRAEAELHYQQLLARWPDDAQIHLAYAKCLAAGGRLDEAVVQYRETKRILPEVDLVYTELGRILIQQGHTEQAVQALREGVKRLPNSIASLMALAWIYATNEDAAYRNAAEAVSLAARANSLTGGEHPRALDTLAAAYAEAQRYREAVQAAELALRAAAGSPRESGIRDRLNLYAQNRPYRAATGIP